MNKKRTIIYFDYGGYYAKNMSDVHWIAREDVIYSVAMKTSKKNITYSMLVEDIRKKIMVDENTTKLKLSFIPLANTPKRPLYIQDDEDVYGYLMTAVDDKSSIYVELIEKEGGQNMGGDQIWRVERETELGLVNEEGMENMSFEQHNDIGLTNMELVLSDGAYETVLTESLEDVNVSLEEDANLDPLDIRDDVEFTNNVEEGESVTHEWEDGIDMVVGQVFENKRVVQDIIEMASRDACFEFSIIKTDTKLYVVKCHAAKDGCKWSIRAARDKNSNCFSIRTYNKKHTCSRTSTSMRNRRKGSVRMVASMLNDDFPGQLNTPVPNSLINMVQNRYGILVSYATAWRGKNRAAHEMRGGPEEGYKMLYSYMYMLEKMNPGTKTLVELDDKQKFRYLFFALGACIEGFGSMRKVIIVDATFLKNGYRGMLIVATAQDPNRHNYPIAFGVVDGENDDSWIWFMNTLKTVIPDSSELVFVSDRHQSLIKSIGYIYPKSQHGYCIYHLSQNVKSKVSGVNKEKVASKFMECAQVYKETEFIQLYGDFRERYPTAAEYLDRSVEVEKWAKCYFPGERYNIDTSNCAESINAALVEARKHSLLPMIDAIIGKLAQWFNKHRKSVIEVPYTQKLVTTLEIELHTRCRIATRLQVEVLNTQRLEYNVIGRDGKNYLVNLTMNTCSCKHFDIDRYPCVHALAAMASPENDKDITDLCSTYFLIEQWAMAYNRTIYPVPHQSDWVVPQEIEDICVLPPNYKKRKGRKQTVRYPSVGEHR